jgi:hypothetical protein
VSWQEKKERSSFQRPPKNIFTQVIPPGLLYYITFIKSLGSTWGTHTNIYKFKKKTKKTKKNVTLVLCEHVAFFYRNIYFFSIFF